ncbi:unnamed protein product, partial [Ilex paraguariensis]
AYVNVDHRHALKHMKGGNSILSTTSVTAYKGNPKLLDYASTKGALADRGICVNGVAPAPIWTPLIPASFSEEEVKNFASQVPMKRAGQPIEVASSYVFLASNSDSSYMSGQVLHPNGMSLNIVNNMTKTMFHIHSVYLCALLLLQELEHGN